MPLRQCSPAQPQIQLRRHFMPESHSERKNGKMEESCNHFHRLQEKKNTSIRTIYGSIICVCIGKWQRCPRNLLLLSSVHCWGTYGCDITARCVRKCLRDSYSNEAHAFFVIFWMKCIVNTILMKICNSFRSRSTFWDCLCIEIRTELIVQQTETYANSQRQ